jgi:hypothetical protein
MGACRADEHLMLLLTLSVSYTAAKDRSIAHLAQHFKVSEVGTLTQCLCLVSLRVDKVQSVANMASYAISSCLILVIHDNMIIGTNLIVLACLCRHF